MDITGISPVLLVSDIGRSVAYHRDRLGFSWRRTVTRRRSRARGATHRRSSSLCPEPDRIVPNWCIVDQTWSVYIRVDGADAAYAEMQERGAAIDYTIYDAPHGFREFGVQDPDGYDIAFGQPL